MNQKKLKILTWHVHGNYLYYLTQTDCDFYIPVTFPKRSGFFGLTDSFAWGENVHEISAEKVKDMQFDCIIFQSNFNLKNPEYEYLQDQIAILSKEQLQTTPKIFIEHDPPRKHPTDTKHILYDSDITIVHVTYFNKLMWNTGITPTTVIEHGVVVPQNVNYSGEIKKGVVVINNLATRGRRLGKDIFEKVKREIPLDLIGMGSEQLGGLGEIPPRQLPSFISQYRFYFHPARYTSLGLSVVEAMMVGLPIVGLATTELPTIIQNEKNGYINTNIDYLIQQMKQLLQDDPLAKKLGEAAKQTAEERFSITQFAHNWKSLIEQAITKATITQSTSKKTNIYL